MLGKSINEMIQFIFSSKIREIGYELETEAEICNIIVPFEEPELSEEEEEGLNDTHEDYGNYKIKCIE